MTAPPCFDFDLPPSLVAQEPPPERDGGRLLAVGGQLHDRRVRDLPELLRPGDLLVLNDTAVLPTRFWGRRRPRPTGEEGAAVPIEATLVEALPDGRSWWALCRPGKRLRPGDRVALGRTLGATIEAKDEEGRVRLAFDAAGEALLEQVRAEGAMPLPPYIRRPEGGAAGDRARYRTVFGRVEGSVAAPTASLHLSHALLEALARRGVETAFVTLHVGEGTFQPVRAERIEDHRMHAERFAVPDATAEAIASARDRGRRLVAAGTTVLRTLETAALDDGRVRACRGSTTIFIRPGWRFRTADLLLTNFHLPRSTLLMLACAFAGRERLSAAYAHAIRAGYRFFSYGDACLLERAPETAP